MRQCILQMLGSAAISAVLGVIGVNIFYFGHLEYSVAVAIASALLGGCYAAIGFSG